jgi:hypothetical protein
VDPAPRAGRGILWRYIHHRATTETPRDAMSLSDPATDLPTHAQRVGGLVRLLSSVCTSVEPGVVQTHISTVILAGESAYKLKKPVRLPSLDFSTLAQRRHFIEEELRINRRTAPQPLSPTCTCCP